MTILSPPVFTVRHSDVLIHERVPLEKPTSGAPLRKSMEAAGLILENAGQAVEFRNVWVVKLN